jgi:hypothetical protein
MIRKLYCLFIVLIAVTATAQTVGEGKKLMYYNRLQSAAATFKQIIQKDAAATEAYYWLFETKLQQGDTAAARQVLADVAKLQQADAKLKVDPLVQAGNVHVMLIDGKLAEAKTASDELVDDTKGKNVEVLLALANAQIDTKNGNYDYALELLGKAQKRDKKNPEVFQLTGDAWRRKGDGGQAVAAYMSALQADPSYAKANYSIGKIYLTQNNQSIYVKHFQDALQQDAAFAPAYYELYYHFYYRDVNEAKKYLEQYIANTDKTVENEYMMIDMLYVSSKNQDAIDMANRLLQQQADAARPRLYKLIAYSYDALGDSVKALNNINTYFQKEQPQHYVAKDYELKARLISKQHPNDSAKRVEAIALWEKATALDTLPENKVGYMQQIAAAYKKMNDRSQEAEWLGKIYASKKDPSNLDLYYWGLAHYAAGEYSQADSVFAMYTNKYPEQLHGYLWRAKSTAIIDSAMEAGLAVPHYAKVIEIADDDSVKNKTLLIQAYGYIGAYEANVHKDYPEALENFEKILALDPGNDDAARYTGILKKWIETGKDAANAHKEDAGNNETKEHDGGKQ